METEINTSSNPIEQEIMMKYHHEEDDINTCPTFEQQNVDDVYSDFDDELEDSVAQDPQYEYINKIESIFQNESNEINEDEKELLEVIQQTKPSDTFQNESIQQNNTMLKPWKPKVLILGPGGVKGFMILGSLLFLETTSLLSEVKTVVGVSIGAIIGLLYVIGCSMIEMFETALSTSIMDLFMTLKLNDITKDIGNEKGLFSHDLFRVKLSAKLIERFGMVPTMKQLYMMTGYTFVSVVTNLDKEREEFLSHETEPDLPVTEAVMMSISVPGFFHMYKYKNNLYVDGGLACPVPVEKYDDGETDILVFLLKDDEIDPQASFMDYFRKILNFLLTKESGRLISNSTNRCKYIMFQSEGVSNFIDAPNDIELRVKMAIQGYIMSYEFYESICDIYPQEYNIDYSRVVPIDVFKLYKPRTSENLFQQNKVIIESKSKESRKKQQQDESDEESSYESESFDSEELGDELLDEMFSDITKDYDSEDEESEDEYES